MSSPGRRAYSATGPAAGQGTVCATKCKLEKGVWDIRNLGKLFPWKTGRTIDTSEESWTEEERYCRELRSSYRLLEMLCRVIAKVFACVSTPCFPAKEAKTLCLNDVFTGTTNQT